MADFGKKEEGKKEDAKTEQPKKEEKVASNTSKVGQSPEQNKNKSPYPLRKPFSNAKQANVPNKNVKLAKIEPINAK